jgi:hypothetical protein
MPDNVLPGDCAMTTRASAIWFGTINRCAAKIGQDPTLHREGWSGLAKSCTLPGTDE